MNKYLVLWCGGYEEPSIYTSEKYSDAFSKYSEWRTDMHESSDRVYLYDLSAATPTVLNSTFYGDKDE